MNNPTDPKVIVGAAAAGASGAVVVLVMNLLNKEPLDQTALQTVVAAVVTFALGYAGGWLKSTPIPVLVDRLAASKEAAVNRGAAHREAGHYEIGSILVMAAVAIVIVALAFLLF